MPGNGQELERVTPAIGIDPANSPAAPERHAWLGLHAASTRSLAQGSMIVFS